MAGKKSILAGDIGGTKTRLAIFTVRDGKLHAEAKKTFSSKRYSGLESVLKEFLANRAYRVDAACFGIAGPVLEGRVETPNLPWVVNAEKLARLLKLRAVSLLNDLEATAFGIFTLAAEELFVLNEGAARRPANQALIAAGTGLGEAVLYDDGRQYHPSASEGGHADFAPRDETEIGLLRYLMNKFVHVSYERVLSGPGLFNIYNFLKDTGRQEEHAWLREKIATAADPTVVITQTGLAGESDICVEALNLFVSIYGAEAGNLALKAKALGGVYVGGGIAPKILSKLKDGSFMRPFADKGRYSNLLSTTPVKVVLNEETALQGAAYYGCGLKAASP